MWGVTLNPGSHHRQKNRGVTRNWSAAPRLINAETKKQSHARRLSVGLFYFRASWGSQQLTRWQGQETPLQSAGNGSLWWAQHTWQFCLLLLLVVVVVVVVVVLCSDLLNGWGNVILINFSNMLKVSSQQIQVGSQLRHLCPIQHGSPGRQ